MFYEGWRRTLLAGGLLDLGGSTNADQTVGGLELLQGLNGVVDQSEAGGLATTVLGAETEDGDLVLVGLVQVGQLLAELILGDVGAVGVEDVPESEENEMSVGRFCGHFWCEMCVVQFRRHERILRMLLVHRCRCLTFVVESSPVYRRDDRDDCARPSRLRALFESNPSRRRNFLLFRSGHRGAAKGNAYTTICLRASRGLRMNLRVRRVTGVSAILVVSW